MRLLVIRTSAMGDVALTTPVLKGMREQFPGVELIMLTRRTFNPFFSSIEGLKLFNPDFRNRHKGLTGLFHLFKDLRSHKIDYVIDLHDVLRTRILRILFSFRGTPVAVINKGRSEKRALISGKRKVKLKHSVERYCDVFAKAGFSVHPSREKLIVPRTDVRLKPEYIAGMNGHLNIGVAPYARHKLKMWPEENMIGLLKLMSGAHDCRFWIFGGKEDLEIAKAFQRRVPNSINLISVLSLDEELTFMSKLDMMIAMDSSNMHMAALVGTKVISIWGGTDPMAGFSAWMQPDEYSIRIPVEELDCRPCTIYGSGKPKRNDFACMHRLTPEIVFKRIEKHVFNK